MTKDITAKVLKPAKAKAPVVQVKEVVVAKAAVEKPTVKESAVKEPAVKKPVVKRAPTKVASSAALTPPVVEAVKATEPAKKIPAEKKAPAVKIAPAVKKAPAAKTEAAQQKAKDAVAPKAAKPAKAKKPKLVRDSFTIPDVDFALFASIKKRLLTGGVESKKSEILRAALINLAKLEDGQLAIAMSQIERIKTGRPKK